MSQNQKFRHFHMNGIYKISFKDTVHFYIGSTSKKISRRLSQHMSPLRSNKHYNSFLQRCFNKHGEQAMIFEVLEELPTETKEEILIREKYWIDTLKPDINLIKDPVIGIPNNSGENHGNAKSDNKTIAIVKSLLTQGIGRVQIEKIVDLSEYKDPAGLIKGLRYNNRWSEIEIIQSYEAIYQLTSPDNKVYTTNNLYGFKKQYKTPWKVYDVFRVISNSALPSEIEGNKGWAFKVLKYPNIECTYNKNLLTCKLKKVIRKLNEEQVKEIVILIKDNKLSYQKIGELFNISEATVREIAYGGIHKEITCLNKKIERTSLNTKINKEIVLEIRRLRNDLNWPAQKVADKLNINRSTVVDVSLGNSWKSIGGTIRNKSHQGENRPNSKLNTDKVRLIKLLIKEGDSGNKLAKQFNISPSIISGIKSGRLWQHVI